MPADEPEEKVFAYNLQTEIERVFDDASISNDGPPQIVIFMGGPAAGKTTIRKRQCSTGFVLVDAADIFLSLSRGEFFQFPGDLEDTMDIIGRLVAQRAVTERRHIVTELIGAEPEPVQALINAMHAAGYRVDLRLITCDLELALQRNANREDDYVSAFYAEPYQRRWLIAAAEGASHCATT